MRRAHRLFCRSIILLSALSAHFIKSILESVRFEVDGPPDWRDREQWGKILKTWSRTIIVVIRKLLERKQKNGVNVNDFQGCENATSWILLSLLARIPVKHANIHTPDIKKQLNNRFARIHIWHSNVCRKVCVWVMSKQVNVSCLND